MLLCAKTSTNPALTQSHLLTVSLAIVLDTALALPLTEAAPPLSLQIFARLKNAGDFYREVHL